MPATYLRITITPHREGSLPGYDGDQRVEWSIAEDAVSLADAQRKTRDALRVLRAFWAEGAPGGLRFSEFARTVLADGNPTTTRQRTSEDSLQSNSDKAPPSSPNEGEIDLVDPLAEKLVKHPNVLPAFLSDLRDWDSFRLLLRRHGGEVPFDGRSPVDALTTRAEAAAAQDKSDSGSDKSEQPQQLPQQQSSALNALVGALSTRERLWQEERASLHAALWAAGEQVRTLVATLTDALDKIASLSSDGGGTMTCTRKTVTWADGVLQREVVRESAAHFGLGTGNNSQLDWKEAEWLKELARQGDIVRSGDTESSHTTHFSPEDILALVRAGRKFTGEGGKNNTNGTNLYVYAYEEDDTEDDSDDETDDELESSASAAQVGNELSNGTNDKDHNNEEDDTESEDERDAALLTARLEKLKKLEAASNNGTSHKAEGTEPSKEADAPATEDSMSNIVVIPAVAPLPPIKEREEVDHDEKRGRDAVDGERPVITAPSVKKGDKSGSDGNVVLIASGRRNRARVNSGSFGDSAENTASQAATPATSQPSSTETATDTAEDCAVLIASGRRRERPSSLDALASNTGVSPIIKVPTRFTSSEMEPTPPSTPPPSVVELDGMEVVSDIGDVDKKVKVEEIRIVVEEGNKGVVVDGTTEVKDPSEEEKLAKEKKLAKNTFVEPTKFSQPETPSSNKVPSANVASALATAIESKLTSRSTSSVSSTESLKVGGAGKRDRGPSLVKRVWRKVSGEFRSSDRK